MEPLISVIIPAYNSEIFIKRCLESVINQSYKNLEIIVVNDGSTDNTKNIVEKIQKKDERIKLINKNNSGVSDSRNVGLYNANGKYIGFVDADDYIENEMYFEMINTAMRNDADIVIISYYEIEGKKRKEIYFPWSDKEILFTENNKREKLIPYFIGKLKTENCTIMGSVWRILIKNEIAKKNAFDKNLPIGEDLIYLLDVINDSNRVLMLNSCLYNYIKMPVTATGKYKSNFEEINEKFHCELLKRLNSSFFENNKIRYEINRFTMYTLSISNVLKNKNNTIVEKNKEIKKIVKKFNNDKYINYTVILELDKSRKLVFCLMKLKAHFLLTLLFNLKSLKKKY